MAKGTNISVTWHAPSGRYRKQIGKQIGRNGQLAPKVHYLGPDERAAKRRALALVAEWDALKQQGHVVWPKMRAGVASVEGARQVVQVNASKLTVGDAIELYREDVHRRAELGLVSNSYRNTVDYRLGWMPRAISGRIPLASITAEDLRRAVEFFVSRPQQSTKRLNKPTTKPISIRTAKDLVRELKAVFRFVENDLEGTGYKRPAGFERLFKIPWQRLRTIEEIRAETVRAIHGEVATYTTEELRSIWHAATERSRLYILMALNFGWTSQEMSDARDFNFELDTDEPFVIKERSKKPVIARWPVWPETLALLKSHRAPQNPEQRWLLNARGLPLVRVTTHRRDAVYEAWKRIRAKTIEENVKRLGFTYVRKTSGNWIKQKCGLEASEMFLSHGETGGEMNRFYANRRWPLMWDSLWAFRQTLTFLDESEPGTE